MVAIAERVKRFDLVKCYYLNYHLIFMKHDLTVFGLGDLGLFSVSQVSQLHFALALLDQRLQVSWSIVTGVTRLVLDHEADLSPRLVAASDHHVLVVSPVRLV